MPFLTDQDREVLSSRFSSHLNAPVKVMLFTQKETDSSHQRVCVTCSEAEDLMIEVSSLSPLIELDIVDVAREPQLAAEWNASLTPTISLTPDVRFLGLPLGYEFHSFVETMVSLSRGAPFDLSPATVQTLEKVQDLTQIKVFSTPT